MMADQGRVKRCCQIGWIGCPILQVHSSKSHREISISSHREISISCTFLQSPHQVDMKNVVKWWKDFLLHFTTLET
jgi:hypothetical protein